MKSSWDKVILLMISIVGLICVAVAIINSFTGNVGTQTKILTIIGFILIVVPRLFWRKTK